MNKSANIYCAVFLFLPVLLSSVSAHAAEENFNSTASGNASASGVSNANCNSALKLFCDEVTNATGVDPTGGNSTNSNGKVWGKGAEAFPGSENGLEHTVSYMSGRTNAIFSSPSSDIGTRSAFIFMAVLLFVGLSRQGKSVGPRKQENGSKVKHEYS